MCGGGGTPRPSSESGATGNTPVGSTTECPPEDKPRIVAIEILDGSDTVVLGGAGNQYVNLPGDDKYNDTTKLKNKDRQTQKPRVKVRFDRPCTEGFKVKLVKGGSNSTYTGTEEGRNAKFLYEKNEKSYTTNGDGTKIFNDIQITAAGGDSYHFTAKDNYGNEVQSVTLQTIRRVYIQELKMTGASAAADINILTSEYASQHVELEQLPSKEMTRIENVGTDTGPFETAARTAYTGSGASAKAPYVVALAYTDHLAVKETPPAITKSGVDVGPGKPAVDIPIIVGTAQKYLWKNIVTGESWFVSASFRKDGGATDVNIPAVKVTPVPVNPAVADMCNSVRIQVDDLTTAVETGTITLNVHIVNRMRGGLSFPGGNLICVCTRAWWQTKTGASQNQVMVHELGHHIGHVPEGTGTGLDKTPNQYTGKGHVGSHCHTGLGVLASYSGQSGTCVMFGATHANPAFCADCAKAAKKADLSPGWSTF